MYVYSSGEDEELVKMLQKGDPDAFTEIYARYWKLLFYVAFKRLNNHEEAQETVQNIFTDLWARRQNIAIHTSLKYYLSAAAQYQVMTFLSKRFNTTTLDQTGEKISSTHADTYLQFRELENQIIETVESLPEKCRLVYKLSRDQGLNNKLIALQLGISEKTVENQLTKALSRIRARLGNAAFLSLFL